MVVVVEMVGDVHGGVMMVMRRTESAWLWSSATSIITTKFTPCSCKSFINLFRHEVPSM